MVDYRMNEKRQESVLRVKIKGVGTYLPSCCLSNDDLTEMAPINPDWVRRKLGISERRIAAPDELTSDLATNAAEAALDNAGVDPCEVQLIVVATTTPDRLTPSTACYVQGKLGVRDTMAFDVSAACSGFLYAITLASSLIEAGQCDNALVIGADSLSRVTDWSSRDCMFFGDGAGAAYLERSFDPRAYFLSALTSDGIGQENFTILPNERRFSIDAVGVYESAKKLISSEARKVLHRAELEPCDIAHVIPHQASINLLKDVAAETGLSFNKFWLNMDRYGNTAAATVPIALAQAVQSASVEDGDWMLFAAAGAGMTAGAAVYRWH